MGGVKIFVIYPFARGVPCISNTLYVPLLCGAAGQELPPGFCGDNSGTHCSERYAAYGICTGYYWVLHNALPGDGYVGFCHYNRFLELQPDHPGRKPLSSTHPFVRVDYRCMPEVTRMPCGMSALAAALAPWDVLLPQPLEYPNCSVRTFFDFHYRKEELDRALAILGRTAPDYLPAAQQVLEGRTEYPHLCFIMKRSLLHACLQWCLELLEACARESRWQAAALPSDRFMPSHLLQRLFNIWLAHARERHNLRVLELPSWQLLYACDTSITDIAQSIIILLKRKGGWQAWNLPCRCGARWMPRNG